MVKMKIHIYRLTRTTWTWGCGPPDWRATCAGGFWGSQKRCLEDATEHALEKHGVRL